MRKKILSLVLALLMAIPSAALVAADETTDDAAAVDATETEASETEESEPEATAAVEAEEEESPYAYAVEFLANYGIFKGYSADNPGIEDDIQRYQMALFVSRISTGWVDDEKWEDGTQNSSTFKDVDTEPVSQYLGAISYANQKGIIEGYTQNTFDPYAGIRYQDALTMVCRTLGYTGLDWPWGFIQQAVNLGLTKGIEDVSYTDELTRGQVAQIIYNALFTPTKAGTTLALANFGIEFAWETVVITASDRDVYEVNGKTANRDFVGFKLYNEDGTVDGTTYYALANDAEGTGFKFDLAKHEDELTVGRSYIVLFEKDTNSNIVKIVDFYPTPSAEYWNLGITDDAGESVTSFPVQTELAKYALVSKYSPANYIGVTSSHTPEIILYNALGDAVVKTNESGLAIDAATGDILVECDAKEASITTSNGHYYKVAWYYNQMLDRYYRYTYNATGKSVFVDYMTDEEFAKTYEDALKTKRVPGFSTAIAVDGKNPYASLVLEDVDLDGQPDRGIYEEYRLGYFYEDTIYCHNGSHPGYFIDSVAGLAPDWTGNGFNNVVAVFSDESNRCTNAAHTFADVGWFAEGFAPSTDEDGEYLEGYVIYSFDPDTSEIKIVKELGTYETPLGTDEDSFVGRGVLNAYSLAGKYVVVDGTRYSMDYNNLSGTGISNTQDSQNNARYTAYAQAFESMYEQYVEFAVVDGKVVAMYLQGTQYKDYFIVKEFSGITNDGYIAVDVYRTSTGQLETVCVGSYNGWKQGDYYYWLSEDKVEDAFTPGTLYFVKSYDADLDVYYIETAGEYGSVDSHGRVPYIVDDLYEGTLELTHTKLQSTNDGYLDLEVDGKHTHVRATNSQKFIILLANSKALGTTQYEAPMIVYEGKLPANWNVEGDRLVLDNGQSNLYIFVNVTNYAGFGTADAYQHAMYLYTGGRVVEAAYDSTHLLNEELGRYILGASNVKVEMFNLYTGAAAEVVADKNISLKKGKIYVAVSGQIVEYHGNSANFEVEMNDRSIHSLFLDMAGYYPDAKQSHIFGTFEWPVKEDITSRTFLEDILGCNGDYTSTALNGIVNGNGPAPYEFDRNDRLAGSHTTIRVFGATFNGVNNTLTVEPFDQKTYKANNPYVTYVDASYIYIPNESGDYNSIVVYIDVNNAHIRTDDVVTKTGPLTSAITVAEDINGYPGVDLVATYTYEMNTNYGIPTDATITEITFEFTGLDKLDHHVIADLGLGFGKKEDLFGGVGNFTGAQNGLYDYTDLNGNTAHDGTLWAPTPWWIFHQISEDDYEVSYNTHYYPQDPECEIVTSITFTGLNVQMDLDTTNDATTGIDEKASIALIYDMSGSNTAYHVTCVAGLTFTFTDTPATAGEYVAAKLGVDLIPNQFEVTGGFHNPNGYEQNPVPQP